MTTTTVKTIGTTGDYTTLQSWEDAAPANLVTADEIWQGQLQNQTFTVAATALTLSGSTSDATRYKELRCVSGASFRDNASVQSNALRYNASNGAAISCTSGNYTYAIVISEQYVRLNGLQVTHSSTGGLASTVRVTVANSLIENCIIETAGSTAGAINYVNCSSLTLKNSLLVQRGASKSCIVGANGSQGTFYNVTMAVPSDKTAASNLFVTSPYTNITLNACAFFGVSALKASGTVTVNNGFSNLSGTGITTATYNTSQFENITDATRDYRLPSGSAMIATYTADTTNSPVDIAGTTRNTGSTQADVGCWEYATAGSSTDLTIQDATHGHAADGLTITVASTLAIADATHAHTADNLTLSVSGATDLTIQDATHGHSADSLTLTLGYVDLTIADALHAHTADALVLTLDTFLVIQEAAHAHGADNIAFTLDSLLAVQEATHGHLADNLILSIPGSALSDAEFRQMYDWISELHLVHGLRAGNPLTVTPTSRAAGAVDQTIGEVGTTVTVTRI